MENQAEEDKMASTSATQDTQAATQTQQSGLPWSQLESQPIQQIWGRLYAKSLKITSLGTKQALPVVSPTVSENYGIIRFNDRVCGIATWKGRTFSNKQFASSFCTDLCEEEFKAGRVEDNHLCIDKTHLPEKMLARISKVHFTIHKDISDLLNPVYIEVRDCFNI